MVMMITAGSSPLLTRLAFQNYVYTGADSSTFSLACCTRSLMLITLILTLIVTWVLSQSNH
jgi:hypothetical protein